MFMFVHALSTPPPPCLQTIWIVYRVLRELQMSVALCILEGVCSRCWRGLPVIKVVAKLLFHSNMYASC